MRFNLVKLGRISLPRGLAKRGMATLNKHRLLYREISQADPPKEDGLILKSRLQKLLGDCVSNWSVPAILIYRKVSRHDDDWRNFDLKRKEYAPGFVHVVAYGQCEVVVGKKKQLFKRGDVFLMNPNVPHEVVSTSLCLTYCFDVAAIFTLRAAKN